MATAENNVWYTLANAANSDGIVSEDVGHWIGVYEELVAMCAEQGLRNERFERRLEYWRHRRQRPHDVTLEVRSSSPQSASDVPGSPTTSPDQGGQDY